MTKDFNNITEPASTVETANIMLRLIQGYQLSEREITDFYRYFRDRGVGVTLPVFNEWIAAAPEQAELQALAAEWSTKLDDRPSFSDAEAEEFHHQFAERFDSEAVLRQPLVIGFAEREKGHAFDLVLSHSARNQRWAIHYTTHGKATLKSGLTNRSIQAGDVLLISPQAEFSLQRSTQTNVWSHFYLSFHPHTDWHHQMQWPSISPGVGFISTPKHEQSRAQQLLNDLIDNNLTPSAVMHDLEANLLHQFILRCRSYFDHGEQRMIDSRVEKAKRYIEQHLAEPFTLEQVSAAAHLSPSRLTALFKAHTDKSVFSWRNERRLIQAASLLRNSDLSIAQIGTQLGFSDATYFSRTFRQHIGCSPRQYRYQLK